MGIRRVLIRRLIPASVISVVLAFSYFTPVPAVVSSFSSQSVAAVARGDDGNNCGYKGTGYHGGKHHKPCKNDHDKDDGGKGNGDEGNASDKD